MIDEDQSCSPGAGQRGGEEGAATTAKTFVGNRDPFQLESVNSLIICERKKFRGNSTRTGGALDGERGLARKALHAAVSFELVKNAEYLRHDGFSYEETGGGVERESMIGAAA
jgi:hypothetical protein